MAHKPTKRMRKEIAKTMTSKQFLAALPSLPSQKEHRTKNWIPLDQFLETIGELSKERKFSGNLGGAPNDSFRGFGATSQMWLHDTANGWKIYHEDNADFGSGLGPAIDPQGVKWVWRTIHTYTDFHKEFFVQKNIQAEFDEQLKRAHKARHDYLWKKRPNRIYLKYPGYYIDTDSGWWINNNEGKVRYRLDDESDVIPNLCYSPQDNHADWWHDGITIQELF